MAKGDVVSVIENRTTGTYLVYQPAAGIEVIVTEAGTESQAADMHCALGDGTLQAMFGVNVICWSGKLLIRNAIYLRLGNANAGTKSLAFTGVQVK